MELQTMGGRKVTSQNHHHTLHHQYPTQPQQQYATQQQLHQQYRIQKQQFQDQNTHPRHKKDPHTRYANKYKQQPPSSPPEYPPEYEDNYLPTRHRYPDVDDPDRIEVFLEDDPDKIREAIKLKQGKWARSNIVATMERYEPSTPMTATLPHHFYYQSDHLNPEYSYAYCEPAAILKQSLPPPPTKLPASASSNTLSKLSSTTSLRALLTKSFRKSSNAKIGENGERHTYTTRYGTKENIYEDVTNGTRGKGAVPSASMHSVHSMDSINKPNYKDELRLVHSHHERIIGELNLSVEELLMPSQAETDEYELRKQEELDRQNFLLSSPTTSQPLGGNGTMCMMNQVIGGDVDSGISGSSSSGASYAGAYSGSMRHYRTTKPQPMADMPTTLEKIDNQFPTRTNDLLLPSSKLSCCFYGSENHYNFNSQNIVNNDISSVNNIESISEKVNFWNKIGKLKISGVFGGAVNSNNSNCIKTSSSTNSSTTSTFNNSHNSNCNMSSTSYSSNSSNPQNCDRLDISNYNDDGDQSKWWKLPVCKSNRSLQQTTR